MATFFHIVQLIKGFKIHQTKLSVPLTRLFSKPCHPLCLILLAGSKFSDKTLTNHNVSSCHVLFFCFAGWAVLADLLRNGSVPFKSLQTPLFPPASVLSKWNRRKAHSAVSCFTMARVQIPVRPMKDCSKS